MKSRLLCLPLAVALVLFATHETLAIDVDQLEDLTGGVVTVVMSEEHDIFTNEYTYTVRVVNKTGDPILAGTLVLVISSVLDRSFKDILGKLEAPNQDGNSRGKPYFVVPMHGMPELPAYDESQPVKIRLRSADYARYYAPLLQIRGIRRTAMQNIEKLVQQLRDKGVLSDMESRNILLP